MRVNRTTLIRSVIIWCAITTAITVPFAAMAVSPLFAWRDPIYISASFAGLFAMALLLLQPLLAGRYLPGISAPRARRAHHAFGSLLITAIVVHVATLWVTSPPDVIDALTFTSPTPFSAWGVIAMWAGFAAALWAASRRRLRVGPKTWRRVHTTLATVVVCGTVAHVLLIEGAMETASKIALSALVLAATAMVVVSR